MVRVRLTRVAGERFEDFRRGRGIPRDSGKDIGLVQSPLHAFGGAGRGPGGEPAQYLGRSARILRHAPKARVVVARGGSDLGEQVDRGGRIRATSRTTWSLRLLARTRRVSAGVDRFCARTFWSGSLSWATPTWVTRRSSSCGSGAMLAARAQRTSRRCCSIWNHFWKAAEVASASTKNQYAVLRGSISSERLTENPARNIGAQARGTKRYPTAAVEDFEREISALSSASSKYAADSPTAVLTRSQALCGRSSLFQMPIRRNSARRPGRIQPRFSLR